MSTPHNVVVLPGSLRKESFSLKVANALAKLAPDTIKLNVVTLHVVPARIVSKQPAPTPNKASCAKRSFDLAMSLKSTSLFNAA